MTIQPSHHPPDVSVDVYKRQTIHFPQNSLPFSIFSSFLLLTIPKMIVAIRTTPKIKDVYKRQGLILQWQTEKDKMNLKSISAKMCIRDSDNTVCRR